MDATTPQRRKDDRRRLWDRRAPLARRSGADRRQLERRRSSQSAAGDRRAGDDRRGTDRRGSVAGERRAGDSRRRRERRRTTPVPYSPRQLEDLRRDVTLPGRVTCPACGGSFTLGPVRRQGALSERLVACVACGRGAVVTDVLAARILVISGATPLRKLLREMLVGGGHDVVEAGDTAVALDAYRAVPADVVILDVVAAGRIEPAEFIRRLRQDFPGASVLAVAGRSTYAGMDPLSVVEGLEDVRGLRVPVSREGLLETVRDVRRQPQAR